MRAKGVVRDTARAADRRRPVSERAASAPLQLTVVLDRAAVGGAEMLMLAMFRRFDPAMVRPRLVCLKRAGELAAEFAAAGFEVEEFLKHSRYDLGVVPRLLRSLRRSRTDVVLVPHYARVSLTLGRLVAPLAGVAATVIAVHGMDLTRFGQRCLPRHDLETLFLSDTLVALGPRQARYLRDEEGVGRYPWRRIDTEIIPNGVTVPEPFTHADRATARERLGLSDRNVVIGIVAQLRPEKAHDVLLRAVAQLPETPRPVQLVVIGDGDRAADLHKLTAELGIADRVVFAGLRRDAPALLPALDISCLCSLHEASPLALIESMAAGLPVVATATGGIPDLVSHGVEGELVPVGDVAALAGSLERLARDPDLRARLGRAGRARVEHEHTITSTAARYQQLFRSLAGKD